MCAVKYLQTKSTTTTYGISSSSTTIQLKNLLKLDGTSVSASDVGDLLYGTFAPGTSREEIFSIVGANVTIETNGNVSITSVTRGLKEVSPYTTGGYSCDHPAGEIVIFGNNPQVYQWLKDYIDGLVIGGGVDASTTAKGISKLSVDPVSATNPIAVGTNDPRIPTTDFTAAMAGTQGVPSATNKYVTEDNVYTAETDQTQATQNGTVQLGEANSTGQKNIICQSFIPSKTKIRGVKLYKSANTGTFTGDITVALFADSAGSPTGSALATVTITNVVYNALAVGEFEALFSAEYSMTAGTLYWFKVSASTADNSNHPNLGTNTAGGYASGSVKYYNGTDGYVAIATIDLYFKTLQGVKSQAIQSDTTGKLPATFYDLSKMPIPAFYQRIVSSSTGFRNGASNSDGSVFVVFDGSSGSYEFQRYERDSLTGYYHPTHSVAATPGSSPMVIVGSYVYLFNDYVGDNLVGYRYNLADLTGETALSLPSISSSLDTWSVFCWTDGVYIYLVSGKTPTTYYKLSISGTTLSTVTTGTCVNVFSYADSNNDMYFTAYDGETFYYVHTTTNNFPYDIYFYKLNDLVGSAKTQIFQNYIPGFNNNDSNALILPIDSDRLYLGNFETIYGDGDGSPQVVTGYCYHLYPVSKP